MAWELLAIWAIVVTTTVWFIRDERRIDMERLNARARFFALAPAFRHRAPAEAAAPLPQPHVHNGDALAETRRRFLEAMRGEEN